MWLGRTNCTEAVRGFCLLSKGSLGGVTSGANVRSGNFTGTNRIRHMTSFSVWWESVFNSLGFLRDFSTGSEVLPKPSVHPAFPFWLSQTRRFAIPPIRKGEGSCTWCAACDRTVLTPTQDTKQNIITIQHLHKCEISEFCFSTCKRKPHFSTEESSHWGESSHFSLRRVQA